MKDSEKKLLFAFVAILALAGLVVLFQFYRDKMRAIDKERKTLALEVVRIDADLEKRDLYLARAEWLDQHQPKFTSEDEVSIQIFEDAGAEGAEGVTVTNRRPIEKVVTPHYVQAGVNLSATGSLESVFRWLHQLQRPEEFRVVSNLTVQPVKDDDSQVLCKFTLLRWYAHP